MNDPCSEALLSETAQNPEAASDAEALYTALSDLIRVYQFRDRDRICCYDVSITQCHALDVLTENEAMSVNDLAAHLYLDKSTTSRVVDALERKGYVERKTAQHDARARTLHMTEAGATLQDKIKQDILREEATLAEGFDQETRASLIALLQRLTEAAKLRTPSDSSTGVDRC
ncbi:MAG: MarR family transcriptional regulator [Gemmatimonadota bacterium]|nr:MarR family transcriptional regulator [Gemmatimonadota bacterium]